MSRIHHFLSLTLLLTMFLSCKEDRPMYGGLSEYPVYAFKDLGVTYTPEATTFKLWSPAAQEARLRLYGTDEPTEQAQESIELDEIDGAWTATVEGDLDGRYYTFQIKRDGNWGVEATDPYARATGTNGLRGQVVNLDDTDPEGWDQDTRPPLAAPTDAVLYELHVRDFGIDENSGIQHKGKFLAFTERGTTTPQGIVTGVDHLVELGVTHVHLLPSFDFMSVDESRLDEPQYNWGYDPQNYNVPEGSYSTKPGDGKARIREFKQMVQALHQAGIRVIMDVVYNHTGRSADSHFQHLIPDYFYRFKEDGSMSDASACGNEIASERPMVRKYIRESVSYWVEEYHVDGFRFDLMGIHDIPTMNEISQSLHAIDSSILLYGEGWTAGTSPLPDSLKAIKANTPQLRQIAAFSDDLRDGLKGSVFVHEEQGFVSGARGKDMSIRFGIVASTQHSGVVYDSVNYSNAPWAKVPAQCINYVSCHDNHTLWDRLAISNPFTPPSQREQMHRLALGIVLTSQGIPFLHAGTEMCRTKNGDENSYKSGDAVNAIRWNAKQTHRVTYDFVRQLIALRKAHPAFRMQTTEQLQQHLRFVDTEDDQLIVYTITDAPGESWSNILLAFNGSAANRKVELPDGTWKRVADGRTVDPAGLGRSLEGSLTLGGIDLAILVKE